MRPVRAISFDLDGTLYRVRRLRVAWRLRLDRGVLLALLAAREKIRHEPVLDDKAALFAREEELVAESFGWSRGVAAERLDRLRIGLPRALTNGVRPYPGVKAAIEAAHAQGLQVAVLSDYDPVDKLRYLGMDRLPWSVVLGAEDLGALKPHPRAFLALAGRMGCQPSDVVHIGDREDLDVAGALASGMRAWRISAKRKVSSQAEHVFSTYTLDVFGPLWASSSK